MEIQIPLRASIYKDRSTSDIPSHRLRIHDLGGNGRPNIYRVHVTYMRLKGEYETTAKTEAAARTYGVNRFCNQYLGRFDNRDFDRLQPKHKRIALKKLYDSVFKNAKIEIIRQ